MKRVLPSVFPVPLGTIRRSVGGSGSVDRDCFFQHRVIVAIGISASVAVEGLVAHHARNRATMDALSSVK